MKPLIIIPARAGSKGVPNKNFRPLPGGGSLVKLAIDVALQLGGQIVMSTDHPDYAGRTIEHHNQSVLCLARPAVLAGDDVSMALVVEHVLRTVPGNPMQPVALLQPTTPNRTVGMVRKCLHYATQGQCAATVSKVPEKYARCAPLICDSGIMLPPRRQECPDQYIFTGDCYAFMRHEGWPTRRMWKTVVVGESLNIDTPADWDAFCESRRRVGV